METSKKVEWQVNKKDWSDEAVLDHLNCCMCGTELRFQHKIDHIHRLAVEDAACPACGVKHRSTVYSLQ